MLENKKLIGRVEHFYPHPSVAVIKLEDTLKVGDRILIERPNQSFEQVVTSMQIEHKLIQVGEKGDDIGLKVDQPTKEGAKVYRVS